MAERRWFQRSHERGVFARILVSLAAEKPGEKAAMVDAHFYGWRRESKRPADTSLRARMKELASELRRFGCRRLHILLDLAGVLPEELAWLSK